jgi:hypothetical protein
MDDLKKKAILSEVLDSEKVQLVCGTHNYVAQLGPPPPRGCADCWKVYFLHQVAQAPPEKRDEVIDELERTIHALVEGAEDFDFKPFARPIIETERKPD